MCLALYVGAGFIVADTGHFDFRGDYIISGHWLPGPVTTFFVAGGILVHFCAIHYLVAIRGLQLCWLQRFGRMALLLYVGHLLLVRLVGERLLRLAAENWLQFAALNLALLAIVVVGALAAERWRARHAPRETR